MFARAVSAWFLMSLLAIANGTLRVFAIVPLVGDTAGHIMSTVLLCALLFIFARVTIGWIGATLPRDLFMVGGLWLSMTVGFEFLAGHYLFGNSWDRLLADYNIGGGRIWILVLITTFLAPWLAARSRVDRERGPS